MFMTDFIQNSLDGIFVGSSYALLAIGFTLIFGVMRRINLAFGPAIMVGIFAIFHGHAHGTELSELERRFGFCPAGP